MPPHAASGVETHLCSLELIPRSRGLSVALAFGSLVRAPADPDSLLEALAAIRHVLKPGTARRPAAARALPRRFWDFFDHTPAPERVWIRP